MAVRDQHVTCHKAISSERTNGKIQDPNSDYCFSS